MTIDETNWLTGTNVAYELDQYAKKAVVGTPYTSALTKDRINSVIHADGVVKEQWTVTMPATVAPSTAYHFYLSGEEAREVSFTTDATPTAAELQAGLVSAGTTDPLAVAIANISAASGNTNVLVTAKSHQDNLTVRARDVYIVTVPATVDNSQAYTVTINGTAATFTTDADATQTELQDGLYSAIAGNTTIAAIASVNKVGNDLVITALSSTVTLTISVNAGATTNDLTVVNASVGISKTATASSGNIIPFGVFIAANTYPVGQSPRGTSREKVNGKLPTSTGDRIIGLVHRVPYLTLSDSSEDAQEGYRAMQMMEIRNEFDPFWVRCVESDITPADTLYIDASNSATRGYVTKTSTNNIPASGLIKFIAEPVYEGDAKCYAMAVESVNIPAA